MRDSRWLEWRRGFQAQHDFTSGWAGPWGPAARDAWLDGRIFARSPPTSAALTSYSLTPSSTTVTEGNTSITFTITRSGDKPAQTIYASTLFDTARSPGDYDGLVNLAVAFSSGQTSRTFTVNINEDTLVEGDERFRVMIGDDPNDGSAQALDISTVTIEDDDGAAPVEYSLTPSSTSREEANTSITFTITRSGAFPAETIYASTLFGTASSPGDYDGLVNLAINFSSGQTSRTFTVGLNEDSLVEGDETFRVMIAHDPDDGSSQALDISTVTIEDDDSAAPAQYSLTPASTTIVEGNSSVTFTITRTGSFPAATIYASTLFDTAASPGDYDGLVNLAVTFASGQTSRTFTVDINEDSLVEGSEHFRVMIGDDPNDGSAQALDISDITITDNDGGGSTQYSLTPASTTVVEGNSAITFTITRTGNLSSPATIYASTLFDTASSPGDYDGLVNHVVSFAANVSTETFTVDINDDNLVEGSEHFRVMIGDDSGDQSAQALDISDIFITDNDGSTPGPVFTITPATTLATEDSQLVFTITRSGSFPDQTVYFSTWQDSATYGEGDYRLSTGGEPLNVQIHFVAGDPTETITLSILQDGTPDAGERFRAIVQGNPPASDPAINLAQTDFITITEGATQDTVYTLAPSHSSVLEGTQLTFTIRRSGTDLRDETIYFSTLQDSATFAEGDYETLSGNRPENIPVHFLFGAKEQTISLRILDDQISDGPESFRAIIQRFESDPISLFLHRSSYVTISDPALPQEDEQLSIVTVVHAGETVIRVEGLRYPVGSGSVGDRHNDGDTWYTARDFGSTFDSTLHPGDVHFHLGEDWNREQGDDAGENVYPVFSGIVLRVRDTPDGFGKVIVIKHFLPDEPGEPSGRIIYSLYAHLNDIFLSEGQLITSRTPIGTVGMTGDAGDSPHLHFELFSMPTDNSIDIYLSYQFNGMVGNTESDGAANNAEITDVPSYSNNEGFTWYNPSNYIDENKDFLLIQNEEDNEIINIFSRGADAVIRLIDNSWEVVASWFEKIKIIGRDLVDRVNIGTLDGTTIDHNTIFFDGGGGDDILNGALADRRIVAEGGTGNDSLTGGSGDDIFDGGDGNDILVGGLGADTLTGGAGDDWYYVDNAGDRILESAGDGNDRVFAANSFTLEAGSAVEMLTTTNNAGTGAINVTGNELANIIYGNDGANMLDGKAGVDTLVGRLGNDLYYVDNAGDRVIENAGQGSDRVFASVSYTLGAGASVELFTTSSNTGTTAINLTGNELANTIYGNDGANVLDGKAGADTLVGRLGDDWYYVDNAADRVLESAGEGNDRVVAGASWVLGAGVSVESLITVSSTATNPINLTGNALAQSIVGNAGANRLDGGGGGDIMVGLGGDDLYYVRAAGDRAVEATGGGSDRVFATVSFTLEAGSAVEMLTTTSNTGTAAINLTGNEFANIIYGNDGANTLDGKAGADTLVGRLGNDLYYVDHGLDRVIEASGEGADRVFASVSYTLGAGVSVELFTTHFNAGTTAINLTGNELANTIYGNDGANVLDGKAGVDTLVGRLGDDWYYVDNAADRVLESAGQGNDRVVAAASYALGAGVSVESLTTAANAGTAAIDLTGNALAQVIVGNAGTNRLDGGGGGDTMLGLGGDDFYYVRAAGDRAVEAAGAGNDRVFAAVSFTLEAGSAVEMLTTTSNTGTTAINLTGNELANIIYGNAGANVLDGKGGSDTLVGNPGADSFAFTTAPGGGNVDRIVDFNGADDTIRLENAVFTALGAPGALNAGAFVTGTAAADADDRIVYNSATGQLFYDADGNGAGAAILFASLDGAPVLGAADFLVI